MYLVVEGKGVDLVVEFLVLREEWVVVVVVIVVVIEWMVHLAGGSVLVTSGSRELWRAALRLHLAAAGFVSLDALGWFKAREERGEEERRGEERRIPLRGK